MIDLLLLQRLVSEWSNKCFGREMTLDTSERNQRFLEEACELVACAGMSRGAAHAILDWAFDKPIGDMGNEIGGVGITLSLLASAHERSLSDDVMNELERVNQPATMAKVAAKQRRKPRFE